MDYLRTEHFDQEVDGFYADYEPTKAARAISEFVQENLSNWYVRLCRRRLKGEYAQDKIAAYQTIYLFVNHSVVRLSLRSLWTNFTET
jgi:isoleucyl-tRNA synthetase